MLETKYDIKNKILSLKEFAHVFTFTREECEQELDFQECFVSIIEHERLSYFIYFLNYEERDIEGKKAILYKESSLKVDRLFFLEVANSTITNKERVNFIFSIIGRRNFSSNNNPISFFLEDRAINLENLYEKIRVWERNPLKNIESSIIYEHSHKNTNYFEALSLESENCYFAYIVQRNKGKSGCTKKSFLVQIDREIFDYLNSDIRSVYKIETIFKEIGKRAFLAFETKYSYTQNSTNVGGAHFYPSIYEQNIDKYNRLISLRDEGIIDSDEIRFRYFELYRSVLKYIKNPTSLELSIEAARALYKYKEMIKNEDVFADIISFMVSIIVLLEDNDFGRLIEKDNSFREIMISSIENIGSWESDLFCKSDLTLEDLAACTIDLEENLKYLVESFGKRKDLLSDEDSLDCDGDIGLFLDVESACDVKSDIPQEAISSKELFESTVIDHELLTDLDEIESEMSDIFYVNDTLSRELYDKIERFFGVYSKMINTIYEFRDIGYSLTALVSIMENTPFETLDSDRKNYIYKTSKSLFLDLLSWKRCVLVEKSAGNIHYLDQTFLTNIVQIELFLKNREA